MGEMLSPTELCVVSDFTLDDLFHDTLKDIYFAVKKILATLPKMAKAAQNDELTAAFEKHRAEIGANENCGERRKSGG